MYSKRAKYKQVANVKWLGWDIMQLLAISNSEKETFNKDVRADYYWLSGLGLYVIIDVYNRDIMNEFRGFKMLPDYLRNTLGIPIWSNIE